MPIFTLEIHTESLDTIDLATIIILPYSHSLISYVQFR